MYQKLFILATIALTAVNAHPGNHAIVNAVAAAPAAAPAAAAPQTFKFTTTFPAPDTIPTAKFVN